MVITRGKSVSTLERVSTDIRTTSNKTWVDNAWSDAAREASILARKASVKANETGKVEDHQEAASLHRRAAIAYGKGKTKVASESAAEHRKTSDEHEVTAIRGDNTRVATPNTVLPTAKTTTAVKPQDKQGSTPSVDDLHRAVHKAETEKGHARFDHVYDNLREKHPNLTHEAFKKLAIEGHTEGSKVRLGASAPGDQHDEKIAPLIITHKELTGSDSGFSKYGALYSKSKPVGNTNKGSSLSTLERFIDWITGNSTPTEVSELSVTENAGMNQPRHGESGQYLPHGSGTGKGDVHRAAVEGSQHDTGHEQAPEEDADDDEDTDEEGEIGQGDRDAEIEDLEEVKTEGYNPTGVGEGRESTITNANPKGCNQYKSCAEVAATASNKANATGTKEDHLAAVSAHLKAQGRAIVGGDTEKVEYHRKLENIHREAATKGSATAYTKTEQVPAKQETKPSASKDTQATAPKDDYDSKPIQKVGGVSVYKDHHAKDLPNSTEMLHDLANSERKIKGQVGVLTLDKVYDHLKASNPSLSVEDFHRQLIKWQQDDKLTLGRNNDPRLATPSELAKSFRYASKSELKRMAGGSDYDGQLLSSISGIQPHVTATARAAKHVGNVSQIAAVYNREWPQSKRDNLEEEDFAGPDQSFPITKQEDVDSASKLIGHADDPEEVKSKIIGIAKRKGLSIPETWKSENDTTENANPDGINQYSKGSFVKQEPQMTPWGRDKGHTWVHSNGDTVRLTHDTIYSKIKNLRDPEKTKQVAVVDFNGKEHKSFSVRGEGHEKKLELASKVSKHLSKHFNIDAKKDAYGHLPELSNNEYNGLTTDNCDGDTKLHNSDNQDPNMSDSYDNIQHEASKNATAATVRSESPKARDHALTALDHSGSDNSGDAADSHVRAARVHENMATKFRKDGQQAGAEEQDRCAALHRKAASMHSANITSNSNGNSMTNNDFDSDDQRKAFFGHLGEAKTSAGEKSKAAVEATKKAKNSKGHAAAAEAHLKAAEAHEQTGSFKGGSSHRFQAKVHQTASKLSSNKRGNRSMNREAILNALTVNCKCEDDRIALNGLSDETLVMVYNAKAEGNNADVVGGTGAKQVGGKGTVDEYNENADEEYVNGDDEEEEGDDEEDMGNVKKGPMTENQYLAMAPPRLQRVLKNALEVESRERKHLVKRLIANESNPNRRNTLISWLKGKDLEELRNIASLTPTVRNTRREPTREPALYMGAAGGPENTFIGNSSDDILPLPTLNFSKEGA